VCCFDGWVGKHKSPYAFVRKGQNSLSLLPASSSFLFPEFGRFRLAAQIGLNRHRKLNKTSMLF